MKRLLALFTAVVFLCSTSSVAFALDNPQEAIAENKVKFQLMNDSILETNKKITDLNTQISKLNSEINNNNKDISEINKVIKVEKANMEQLSKEISASQDLANKRLRAMYINSYNESILGLLLTAENFSDLISKFEAARSIVTHDKSILDALSEKRQSLKETISNLDAKNKQLEDLKTSNTQRLNSINEDKLKLETLIKQFNEERAAAAELIKENEEKLIAHAVSVIDSNSTNSSEVKNVLQTLRSLLPQITTSSVKTKTKDYMAIGNMKLINLRANENPTPNRGGSGTESYKATYTMQATAYYGGSFTAMGLKPVRDPDGLSTIAVDPRVIPLGTKVYIPGYGTAIASDTGGAIKGNIIDLYMNTYEECIRWGRRPVTLHVVAYPGEW